MYKFYCPYCNNEISNNFDDYDLISEEPFFIECPDCNKVIKIQSSVIIDVWGEKCDCQLENHEYEFSLACPKCCSTMRCKHCGEERPLTDDERKQYGVETKAEYLKSLNDGIERVRYVLNKNEEDGKTDNQNIT
jgi:hypothetical protein